jgi:hypothetical protein
MSDHKTITLTLPVLWCERLRVLGPTGHDLDAALKFVLVELADHAQQGVYRPGSWERPWLNQAFGLEWENQLEPDTDRLAGDGRIIFQRPRQDGGS